MGAKTLRAAAIFLALVVAIHVVTYFVAGLLAASLLDYRGAFARPIIRDYMVEFGSASLFWGPVAQLLRGLVIGLALLPLRGHLAAARRGWLQLWLVLVALGIVATPAAAPSSIEGLVYTRLPLWYHAFGLPEMLLQTLAFSVAVHRLVRRRAGLARPLPAAVGAGGRALAGACFAFAGYAVASVAFALVAGADLAAGDNLSPRTQGLFVAPLLLNFALLLAVDLHGPARRGGRAAIFALALLGNAAAIALYQALILGGVGVAYALVAPILPAAIVAGMVRVGDDAGMAPAAGRAPAGEPRGRGDATSERGQPV
jgi:hypothetical protein